MENEVEYLAYQLEEMHPVYQYIIHSRFKVTQSIIRGLGAAEWYSLLHEIVGRFVTEKPGIDIDTAYDEVSSMYPYLMDPEVVNPEDQLSEFIEFERKYRLLKSRLEGLTDA